MASCLKYTSFSKTRAFVKNWQINERCSGVREGFDAEYGASPYQVFDTERKGLQL
jgi:hypothetical protein